MRCKIETPRVFYLVFEAEKYWAKFRGKIMVVMGADDQEGVSY